MLAELRVKNFVLIDHLSMSLDPGLNVLSGETGSGKSIILGALNLLTGSRGSTELVRDGADQAVVEGLFWVDEEPWVAGTLEQLGLEPASELWIRRVIPRTGRSRAYLNGGPVPLATLKVLARALVDVSSQNEHRVLLNADAHLAILDGFADHTDLTSRMRLAADALQEAFQAHRKLLERQQSGVERAEFLRFQLAELDRVAPEPGEDEALERERRRLAHAEKLHSHARHIEEALYSSRGAVVEVVGDLLADLREMAGVDPELEPQVEILEGVLYTVEDIARVAGAYARDISFDPHRLEEVTSRLAELSRLKRKYRTDLEGLIHKRAAIREELETLEDFDAHLEEAQRRIQQRWKDAAAIADALTEARHRAARKLETAIESELQSLSMPRARFGVRVEVRHELGDEPNEKRAPGKTGNDRVAFYFSANAGEPLRPLASVASGGELSRVSLAMKRVLAGVGDVGTFLFDEVDAGIGGAVAEVVGRKLRDIARNRQLICITHLPQVAAFADRHFAVGKSVVDDRTISTVTQLDDAGRVEELARMMGGVELTERTLAHAREMVARSRGYSHGA